jgi:hypothetical protein
MKMVFKMPNPKNETRSCKMMKRLLPVAAAVVIGLSPSFAAAASKGKVYSNRAKAYRAYKANERKADVIDAIITNGKVNAHGKGVNMAFGRVNMKFEGAVAFNYAGKNGYPQYVTEPNLAQPSGNLLSASFMLPLEFRINRDVSANVTLSAGNDLRTTYFADIGINGGGINAVAHGGWSQALTVPLTWTPRVEDAYMTYRMGNFAIFGGWMTSGLTPIDISPANPVAQFHDLMEYTGVNLGAMFSNSGFYATAALVDPGVSNGRTSRRTDTATDLKMDNYSVSLGYAGKSGNTRYVFGAKYLNQIQDLTYLDGISGSVVNATVGSKPHGYGFNAGAGFGKFGVAANYVVLENSGNFAQRFVNNDAKLLDLDLSYQINRGSKASVFYNDNSKGNAFGLARKQYGLKGSYQLAHNTDLTAALWKEKRNNSAANTTRSSTRFNLTAAYYLGGK